jgi:hypothetical protein
MTNHNTTLLADLAAAVQGDAFWEPYLATLRQETIALHLAIFVEPYLQYVLEGKKTVESRFATRRFAPYQQVSSGDVLLLKASGGPIMGICQVAQVWFYHLDPESWQFIQAHFTEALCAQDPAFWTTRQHATFATLMRVCHVYRLAPFPFAKRDRRGWVVLRQAAEQMELAL